MFYNSDLPVKVSPDIYNNQKKYIQYFEKKYKYKDI